MQSIALTNTSKPASSSLVYRAENAVRMVAVILFLLSSIYWRPALAEDTLLISVQSQGTIETREITDPLFLSALTADGRFVLVNSNASNLTDDPLSNNRGQLYRYDRLTDQMELVSTNTAGVPADGRSLTGFDGMSDDGRFVVFASEALNLSSLVAETLSDGSSRSQVYLRNMQTGVVTLVSRSSSGAPANQASSNVSISGDGTHVVYQSSASNLVAGDVNGQHDIFRFDIESGTTVLVSTDANGNGGDRGSFFPRISADGGSVSFSSSSSNFAMTDTVNISQIYLKNLNTNSLELISAGSNGAGDRNSSSGLVSPDGSTVYFQSFAGNLLPNVSSESIYRYRDGTLELASRTVAGDPANSRSILQDVRADGEVVYYLSLASNLLPNANTSVFELYQYNFEVNSLSRVTNGGDSTRSVVVNADSSYIAFEQLRDSDAFGARQYWIRRQSDNTLQEVLANSYSTRAAGGFSEIIGRQPISADGTVVAFQSDARDLVTGETSDRGNPIYIYEENTDRASLLFPSRVSDSSAGFDNFVGMSDDGRIMLIESTASDLVANDTNGLRDLFLVDTQTDAIARVNDVLPDTNQAARVDDGNISGDGRWVVFTTVGNYSDLPSQSEPNSNVYLADTLLNQYYLVGRNTEGEWANGDADDPSVDATGRYVVFSSDSTDLIAPALTPEFRPSDQIWLWDRETGRTSLVTVGVDGEPGDDDSRRPIISADGTAVTFTSEAENLVATADRPQVYHADLSTGSISLVSQSEDGEPADGRNLFLHSIAGDGSMVSFVTNATNLGPKADEDDFQGYIWRRSTTALEGAALSSTGGPPNDGAGEAYLNRDGTFVVFTSFSTNLGDPANDNLNVFRRSIAPQEFSADLFSSVLPSSRSVNVGSPYSLFATLIATGEVSNCRLRLAAPGTSLTYRLSDPLTNNPIGEDNPAFDLSAGQPQSFILQLQTNAATEAIEMPVLADCRSGARVTTLPAINSFVLTASTDSVPDVIALAATQSGDGVLDLPASGDFGAFSVASINLGAADDMRVRARASGQALTDILLCETQPDTGACLNPPASLVSTLIGSGAAPTFSIFARSESPVSFDPAGNRLIVEIVDSTGEIRGRTSVAVR